MAEQQKVVLVIGAGDATGGEIAKRFAREGYTACVTRRQAEKLQPLLDEIRAAGGRPMALARMRARKKKWPN
jgi:NAD(P)-dependent dehydrogenase (short-subunit alcohol dehydrogenase family)